MTHKTDSGSTGNDSMLSFYRKDWDPEVGLWRLPGPGHTPDTRDLAFQHPARESAWLLVAAGLDNVLDQIETGLVLRTLRSMQNPDGPKRGCFRWSWEDRRITDSNGSFFTGLGLIVLFFEFGDRLAPEDRPILRTMLKELRFWFDSEMDGLGEKLRYPNKCLGDLVCGWLLAEIDGAPPAELEANLKQGAAYYRNENWGWGEHLSDIYSTVCKCELTALLMYAKALPPALQADYERLFRDLLALDAVFAGGPRVPAIRSYSLEESPQTRGKAASLLRPFLDTLEPWSPEIPRKMFGPLRSLAHARGVHLRYAGAPAKTEYPDVPCFGGAVAQARVTPLFRLGVLSRYPLMADTEHPTWGLCWQSMPVCYWNGNGDWAYLQWETREGETRRAHPAFTRHHRGQVQLTEGGWPPFLGETFGRRHGSQFLVLRRMSRLAPEWSGVADRFRLFEASAAAVTESREAGWHALTLDYPDCRHRLRLLYRPLTPDGRISLSRSAPDRVDWEARWPLEAADRPAGIAGLWLWQADETLPPPPSCTTEGSALVVTFPDATFRIAPDSDRPQWA